MDRLTFLDNGKPAYKINDCLHKNEIASKLFEYENIQLTPKRISELQDENEYLRKIIQFAAEDFAHINEQIVNFHLIFDEGGKRENLSDYKLGRCACCRHNIYYQMEIPSTCDCAGECDFQWKFANLAKELKEGDNNEEHQEKQKEN